jgi:NADPH:quinone reductase-like Zn-dependent oxidoreductase
MLLFRLNGSLVLIFFQLPEGSTLAEAVTLPNNFVTVFHTLTTDLDIEIPWPKPVGYVPKDADKAILVWGGSSSVGQFAIQILKYYGYMHILATASTRHHEKLRALGAEDLFDYNDANVVEEILRSRNDGKIPLIFDCIGSQKGSMAPISKIANAGAKVAILLPVIIRDSSETEDPEYEMDVKVAADWARGVDARGVRTYFYLNVSFKAMS